MIQFSCTCQYRLEVPEDQAGASLQCPRCGLLIDVPTLGELSALSDDGTYKMEQSEDAREADRLANLHRTFSRNRYDAYGREIDLRPTQQDLAHVGEPEELELADDEPGRPPAPKYDPVTGELIRPLDVKAPTPPADANATPIAGALLHYGRRRHEEVFTPSLIIPHLFHFANFVVVGVVFLMHIFLQMMLMPIMAGFFLVVPFFIGFAGLFLAHYACVVDEIATEERDELPRPLRNLSWNDDLWRPFVHFAGALTICYGPAVSMLYMPKILAAAMGLAVLIAGTIGFPAVLLTLVTSGTWLNLSPDRLLRVMRAMGPSYVLCVVLWASCAILYVVGMVGTGLSLIALFMQAGSLPWYLSPPIVISYPMLLLAVIAMHGFCWYLGLQYREHHHEFGWAFQFHARQPEVPRGRGFPAIPARPVPARRARQDAPMPAIPVTEDRRE